MSKLWLGALAFGLTAMGTTVSAQTQPAFSCSGNIYQVQSGQLRIFDPITSTYQNVGAQVSDYNATGYNILDNYVYALQRIGNSGSANLVRIGSDGSLSTVFANVAWSFSGDVDTSNNYWTRVNNLTYRRTSLITGATTDFTFTGSNSGPADVAYAVSGGVEYLIGFSGGTMHRYNINTPSKETISIGLPDNAYGATWRDVNGRLFTFSNNTGLLYEVTNYFTNSPSFQQVGIGDPSNSNDGFSCSLAAFPNLAPLAFDDAFTTPVETPVSGNLIADNGNGTDNDPDGGPVTVVTTPLNEPSNGSVVLNANGDFTYTPDPGFFGTDTFTYQITDSTGLTSTATVTITVVADPQFTVEKNQVNGPSPATAAGDVLTYEIEVDNTGDIALTDVQATDTLPNGSAVTLSSPDETGAATNVVGQLDVGEMWTYTITYTVTQDDIDSGANLVNTASVTTSETGATPQTDTETTSVGQSPSYTVEKTSDTTTLTAPGTISYEITLENTGNVTLANIVPTDTLLQGATPLALTTGLDLSGDTDGDGDLDLDETWVYTATYDVTQDDIDDGATISNEISIASDNGPTQTSDTQTTIDRAASFSLAKSVNQVDISDETTLTYEVVVTNTGNVSLTGVSLVDTLTQGGALTFTTGPTLSGDTDSDNEIDVGEIWVYTSTFDVSQAQIDDGGDIENVALVDTDQTSSQNETATTTISQTSGIAMTKSVAATSSSSYSAVGDTIDFTYVVTNTGNTTLTGPITVDDDQIGNGLACSPTDLLPGESISCDHTWTADLADLNAGSVTNIATAEDDNGETSDPQQQTVSAVQTPALSIDKQLVDEVARPLPTIFQAGETLYYDYVVTNTGNVTITENITVSDNVTPTVCPPLPGGVLAPTESITCSAEYDLTSSDVGFGSTTNVASASTTFNGDPVTSLSDTAIFPVTASPVIALDKSAPSGLTVDDTTDTITYSYEITYDRPTSGTPVALTEIIFINDDKFDDPIVCYDPAVEGADFLPGDTHVCEAVYTVTQADLDAGEVLNEATANTTFAPGSPNELDVVSNVDTATVPVAPAPALEIEKTVAGGNDPAAVGDLISYQIVATNTGNQTLNTVAISDPLLGALTCDLTAPVTLAGGEALTCTGSYTVQQSDIDDQVVGDAGTAIFTNTATAVANDPDGNAITPVDGSVDHPVAPAAPSVSVLKELFPDPSADPAFTDLTDVVRYRVIVTNNGNMTLSSVDVTDSIVAGTCTVGTLAPGASDNTCTFDYTVVQDDLDRGFIDNTATAEAQPIDPTADTVSGDDTLRANGPGFAGALEVVKAGTLDLGGDGIATVGDLINYTITVTNVGNVTLTDIEVTDPGATTITIAGADDGDNDNDIDSLATGASVTVTATHALTQGDIDNGSYANTATATGEDPAGDPVSDDSDSASAADGPGNDDPTVTPIPRDTGLTVDKSFTAAGGTGVGDTITYSYEVTNTGNVTLTTVDLTDDHTSATGTAALSISSGGSISSLAPGDSATLTATYVITQDDIDAGDALTNIVTATGTGPTGTTPSVDTDNETVDVEAGDPEIEVIKTVRSQTGSDAGDTVVFEVAVENTGNVSLDNIALTDTLARTDNTPITPAPTPVFESGDGGTANVIDVDETWIYTVTYVLTQDDVDAGGIRNSVTATGDAPNGDTATDVSDNGTGDGNDPTVVSISPMPSIEAIKTITSSTVEVGQTVTFEITVENTGNVTLNSVDIASDTLTRDDGTVLTLASGPTFAGSDMGSLSGALMVGETATYTASYVLVQEDIDAGSIANTATAQASPPVGSPVTDISDDDGPGSDPTILTFPSDPEIGFDKRLVAGGPSFVAVDDVLSYEFEITNLGNVTLTAPYDVADPLITDAGGTISCPSGDLAPGDSLVCTADYSVVQADLDAGEVENTATATVGDADPVSDTVTVPGLQLPALDLVKTADTVESEDFVVGALVTYMFETTNVGNVTITDPITIDDSLIDPSDITCDPFPSAGVAPGESYTCTGEYTVTSDDVQIASVTNLATATDGTTTSPIGTATIPNDGTPALSIDKELIASLQPNDVDSGGLTYDEVGDQLEYRFTVTNTGQVSFANDIEVIDTYFDDPIACFDPTTANPDVIPGESIECTAIYVITQDDLDAGEVLNEAFARTEFGSIPTIVQSAPDTETALVAADPMVTIEKDVDRTDYAALGETVTYDFTVTNTGNQTLTNVVVSDPLIPTLDCEATTLAVGDDFTCSATYDITQDDIDNGGLTNIATANGTDPTGSAIPSVTDDATMTGPSVAPTLGLAKIANPDPFGDVGTAITYTFEVTNTSIYTMSDVTVTDPLPGTTFTCVIGTMAPGAVDDSCQLVVPVTQEMVDDGELENTATVTGEDPFANVATATDTITTDGPPEDPSLEATKLVDVPQTTLGTTITYTLIVQNTGNVSLSNVTPVDTMTRNDNVPLTLTTPFVLISGDDGDGALNPTETWTYEATYRISQADINFGGFENFVDVNGESPSGTPVTDRSDDGNDGDGNTTDDPTVVSITTDPVLDVTKTITTAGAVVGDTVVFEIQAANTGNVDILNAEPTDTLTRLDGTDLTGDITGPTRTTNPSDNSDATLDPGEYWSWEVSYTLTQDDIDAGGISNTVDVTGEDSGGDSVTDTSDNGNDTDGNITDDPTVLTITPAPGIEAVKTGVGIGDAVGDLAEFTIEVTNTGNVTLTDLTINDTMTNFSGDVLSPVTVTPAAGQDDTLDVGEVATFAVSYELTQDDIDSGGVSNIAVATGTTPGGLDLIDQSDNGIDGDGNTVDDPTVLIIAQEPSIEAVKTLTSIGEFVGDLAEFSIAVMNNGNVTLTDVSVEDTMTNFDGDEVDPVTITPAAGVDDILTVGETAIYTVTYVLTQEDVDSGGLNNVAIATGTTPDDAVLTDQSDNGDDDDGNTTDDPTVAIINANPSLLATKAAGVPNRIDTNLFELTFTMTIENTGNLTLTSLVAEDDLTPFVEPATLTSVETPVISGFTTGEANTAYDGIDTINMLTDDASLAPGETGTIVLTIQYETDTGVPDGTNTLVVTSDQTPEQAVAVASVSQSIEPDILATKSATPEDVFLGSTVTYTLTFENLLEVQESNLTIVDALPAGIVYTPESAELDGEAFEPEMSGRTLRWEPVSLDPGQTITITFEARVASGRPGEYVNRAYALDAQGNVVSNIATATVARRPEAVFDCADIIGKVFDDRNQNGYQDGIEIDRAAITVQDFFDEKFERPEGPEGEPGLPGVRLSTVDGTLITTDEFGRFSVPCAELPASIGSNFQLKLDTRTLPTGYHVTTENPRNVRVTPGRMTRLNFGATLSNLIEIDLTSAAFNGAEPSPALAGWLPTLVSEMETEPSVLRLTYYRGSEDQNAVNARLDALEDAIRRLWSRGDRYRLTIERTIHRVQ